MRDIRFRAWDKNKKWKAYESICNNFCIFHISNKMLCKGYEKVKKCGYINNILEYEKNQGDKMKIKKNEKIIYCCPCSTSEYYSNRCLYKRNDCPKHSKQNKVIKNVNCWR